MSKELQELIELGQKYGLNVSGLTEQQAQEIIAMSNEWKGIFS